MEYMRHDHLAITLFHEARRRCRPQQRHCADKGVAKASEGDTVSSYCKAINQLLETYATDDIIAKTDGDMMQLTQLSNESTTEYVEEL